MIPWFSNDERMGWHIRIPLFVGQINIKPAERSLFSERYGKTPSFVAFGLRVTWRKWRRTPPRALSDKGGEHG